MGCQETGSFVMSKRRALNIFFLVLTIITASLIFFFSSQNGDESTKTSSGVVRFILSIFIGDFNLLNLEEQNFLILKYSHLIRKLAHFSEFALLSFSFFCYLSTTENRRDKRVRIAYSFILCFLYALGDEFHQFFSSNRSPRFKDVLVDSSGGLFGIFLAFLIFYLAERGEK